MDELDRLFQRVVRGVRDTRPENLSRSVEVGELLDLIPYRSVRSEIGVETNDDFAHVVTRFLAGERGYLFVDDLMQDDLKTELASPNPNLEAYRSYVNARVTLSQEHTRRLLESMGPATETVEARAEGPVFSPSSPSSPSSASIVPAASSASAPSGATPPSPPSPPSATPARSAVSAPEESAALRTPTARAITPRREPPTAPRAPRAMASPRPLGPDSVAVKTETRPGCKYCGQALPEGREVRYCPACGQNLLVRRCAACSAEVEPAWKFCVACGRAAAP